MLRKTTAAVVLAGALALGTASATSLGDFNDISFAASDVDLEICAVDAVTDLLDLTPVIPEPGDLVPADDSSLDPNTLDAQLPPDGGTLLLDSLDLTAMVADLHADCEEELGDLVVMGDTDLDGVTDTVMTTVTGIDLTDPAAYSAVDVVDAVDIAVVSEVRLVVRNNA